MTIQYSKTHTIQYQIKYYIKVGVLFFIFTNFKIFNSTICFAQNVGIGTATPIAPLHVKGQTAVTIPNGTTATAHVTTLINDISAASGTDSKIGLYASVQNHNAVNVSILAECLSTNNANNYGIISQVTNDPGPTGNAAAIAAVDLVKSPDLRTFALKIDGKAQYAGVPDANVTGTVLTNAGDGLMEWKENLPSVFLLSSALKDTTLSNSSKRVRFNNTLSSSSGKYNIAGNYNRNTGELTITEAGFYHLTLNYDYWMYSSTNFGKIYSAIKRNGNVLQQITHQYIAEIDGVYGGFGNLNDISNLNQLGSGETFSFSCDSFLDAGDILTIIHENDTDGNQYVLPNDSSFSGFKVR
jgi:hypothetical protein